MRILLGLVLLLALFCSPAVAHVIDISDASVKESDSGTTNCVFTVTLTTPGVVVDTANFNTVAGSATSGSDFTPTLGSISFPIGSLSQTISIPVLADNTPEINETFSVILSNSTATPGDLEGVCTILDDDTDAPGLTAQNLLIQEGDSGTTDAFFTVSLSPATAVDVTFDYTTIAGTASAADYDTVTGSAIIQAGDTSVTIPVPIVGDTAAELNETLYLAISNETNATVVVPQGMGIIQDNDGGLLFSDLFADDVLALDWTYTKGTWTEGSGVLTGTYTRKASAIAAPVFAGCSVCSVSTTLNTQFAVGGRVWLLAWFVDKKNTIELMMKEETDLWIFRQKEVGKTTVTTKIKRTIDPNTDYQVFLLYDGQRYLLFINGEEVLVTEARFIPQGTFGLQVKGTTATYGELIVN